MDRLCCLSSNSEIGRNIQFVLESELWTRTLNIVGLIAAISCLCTTEIKIHLKNLFNLTSMGSLKYCCQLSNLLFAQIRGSICVHSLSKKIEWWYVSGVLGVTGVSGVWGVSGVSRVYEFPYFFQIFK